MYIGNFNLNLYNRFVMVARRLHTYYMCSLFIGAPCMPHACIIIYVPV